jgi:thiol-disulfide isomerase/thioredoxin
VTTRWKLRLVLGGVGVLLLGVAGALGLLDLRYLVGFCAGAGAVAVLIVVMIALITRMARQHQASEPTYPEYTGPVTFDYAWSVRAEDGSEIPLERLRGKGVFMNFWATWCMPCVAELPSIARLRTMATDMGVEILCLTSDSADRVHKLLAKSGISLPVHFYEGEPPALFASDAIPATFILARDGTVAFRYKGSAKWDGERTLAFLRRLVEMPGSE